MKKNLYLFVLLTVIFNMRNSFCMKPDQEENNIKEKKHTKKGKNKFKKQKDLRVALGKKQLHEAMQTYPKTNNQSIYYRSTLCCLDCCGRCTLSCIAPVPLCALCCLISPLLEDLCNPEEQEYLLPEEKALVLPSKILKKIWEKPPLKKYFGISFESTTE